jgi:hypothetical protein
VRVECAAFDDAQRFRRDSLDPEIVSVRSESS